MYIFQLHLVIQYFNPIFTRDHPYFLPDSLSHWTVPCYVYAACILVFEVNWWRNLGEVELERIVGGQRDEQTSSEELGQRIAVIVEKQRVVAQRRHGDADLRQVIQVLQHRRLTHTHTHTQPSHNHAIRSPQSPGHLFSSRQLRLIKEFKFQSPISNRDVQKLRLCPGWLKNTTPHKMQFIDIRPRFLCISVFPKVPDRSNNLPLSAQYGL